MLLDGALLVLALAMVVAIGRVATGPSDADRVLGLDFGFAVFIAALAVLSVRLESPSLVDLVLAVTLVGFLGTVAFTTLVERRSR
jgi:multicomponent Na+:H+ antiporter subunit F